MKKYTKYLLTLFLGLFLVGFLPCMLNIKKDHIEKKNNSIFYYENVCKKGDNLEKIIDSVLIVEINKVYTNGHTSNIKALCTNIGNGFGVILSHTFLLSDNSYMRTPYGLLMYKPELHSKEILFNEKEVELIGSYQDISVIKLPDYQKDIVIDFGDSNELKNGTKLISIGFSSNIRKNIKNGIVSFPNCGKEFFGSLREVNKEWYINNTFLSTLPCNGGDSGGIVISKNKCGKFEIVGLVCSMYGRLNGMTFSLKSNYVKYVIKKILNSKKKV